MESIEHKSDKILILLLALMPLALAAGPAIIEMLSLITIVLFFIFRKKFLFDKREYLIFILFFFLILSSLFSEFKIHSLQSSIFLIRIILLFYIFKLMFKTNTEELIKYTLLFLIITFVVLIFDIFFQYLFQYSFFGTEKITDGRMSIHFREESIIGAYLSKTLPIFVGLWLYKFKSFQKKTNYIFFFISSIVFTGTLITNERAASGLLILFFLILFFFSNLKFLKKILLILLFGFSLSGIIYFNDSLKKRFITETIEEVFGKNDDFLSTDNTELLEDSNSLKLAQKKLDKKIFFFSTAHEAHIRTALNMFYSNFILGVGPNNFRNLCSIERYGIYPERGCSTHPHHIFSQVLAETGIIGIFFYIVALVLIIFKLVKQFFFKNLVSHKLCLYSFYFVLILPILPSGNIFSNWYLYSIFLPFFYLNFIK